MRQLVGQVRKSAFIRQNIVFFVGSLAIGLLNYLYYPVLGRLLPPSRFGEVQVLASLFAQVVIFLNVLGLITVNIVANYDDERRRNQVILELERLAVVVAAVLLALSVAGATLLQRFFHFGTFLPFPILVLAVVLSVPLTFRSAYLRGLKHFGAVAAIGIVGSAADLVLATAFVLAGWGTSGAMLGLVLGQLMAFGYAAAQAKRNGFAESWRASLFRLPDLRSIRPELKYALLVLVCSLSITGLYSVDTIVVKHYFDARTAGLYAGISTIARIVLFVTSSVTQVLLPSIKLSHTPRQNQQVLLKSFVLLVVVGGAVWTVFALAPRLVIRVLMGGKYLPYAALLPRLSLVIFIISLLNLFIMYHIALRRYVIILIVILGVIATLGMLAIHHQTLRAVIDSLLFGSLAMLALLGGWMAYLKCKRA